MMTLNQEKRIEYQKAQLQQSKNFKVTCSYDVVNKNNKAKVDKMQI